jgi:hypothetical protein
MIELVRVLRGVIRSFLDWIVVGPLRVARRMVLNLWKLDHGLRTPRYFEEVIVCSRDPQVAVRIDLLIIAVEIVITDEAPLVVTIDEVGVYRYHDVRSGGEIDEDEVHVQWIHAVRSTAAVISLALCSPDPVTVVARHEEVDPLARGGDRNTFVQDWLEHSCSKPFNRGEYHKGERVGFVAKRRATGARTDGRVLWGSSLRVIYRGAK